ncbi:MAG TPA: 6,7-dimethyl-8-ribityllumazine synthase [Candidatus Avalokitesvara rifleensis]|uniref:6,7-dimethyl-8-ribityllumazine synthase n=1 Tax=Candidatus Avalokitesvara rifleensis TaxID=3367620 RepID=UPI00271386B1|nr:6,7-dimethyl-8-ribityllumazine synthase [Candidatus Brocadiales bacterium]
MGEIYQGDLIGTGKTFCLVVSRFNEFITRKLLEGAQDCLLRHGVKEGDIDVCWVPGSFEIPSAALVLAKTGRYNAIVCLGAVLRGQTPHFEYVASEASKGVAHVGLETGVPTIFGVITAETLEHAVDRAGTRSGNRGSEAAKSAIEMANLFGRLNSIKKKR